MSYLTLKHGATERTVAAWGISLNSLQADFRNLTADTLSFTIAAASLTDDPLFAFEDKITLYSGRTSATGAENSFSGGVIEFVGYRLNNLADGRPEFSGVHYVFANAWYFLEQSLFQQVRANIPTTYPDLTYKYTSDLSLFCKLGAANEFVKLTNGEQIEEALQFVLDNPPPADATPFQIGTIDPGLNLPTFQCAEVSCAAVIRKCLEPSPDCTLWFDYTTTPPTVHVRKRANLTAATLAFANGVDHKSLALRPCYELVPRSVLIYYRVHSALNGTAFVDLRRDKYGPHGANSASDPDAGHRVLIQTFDLDGPTSNRLSAVLEVETCNANHASQATRLAWWAKRERKLQNTSLCEVYGDAVVEDAVITAANDQPGFNEGDTVSLAAYPNVLLDTVIQDWMRVGDDPVVGVKVVIKTDIVVQFRKRATPSSAWSPPEGQVLSLQTQVTLTNGTAGTYISTGGTLGEAVPEGVAQEIYTALSTLQFEGEDLRVAATPGTAVTLGHKLNLSGGRSEWATMNAQIQRIAKQYGLGSTALSIGPARHITAGDIVGLCLFNRTRRVKESNQVRVTGQP